MTQEEREWEMPERGIWWSLLYNMIFHFQALHRSNFLSVYLRYSLCDHPMLFYKWVRKGLSELELDVRWSLLYNMIFHFQALHRSIFLPLVSTIFTLRSFYAFFRRVRKGLSDVELPRNISWCDRNFRLLRTENNFLHSRSQIDHNCTSSFHRSLLENVVA